MGKKNSPPDLGPHQLQQMHVQTDLSCYMVGCVVACYIVNVMEKIQFGELRASLSVRCIRSVSVRHAQKPAGWLACCLKNFWLLASLSAFLNSPYSLAHSFVDVDSRFLLQIL